MDILTHQPKIPINVASIVDAHIYRLAVIYEALHRKTPDHPDLKSLRRVIAGSEFIARNLETTKYLLRDIKASVAPRQPGEITKTIGNLVGKTILQLLAALKWATGTSPCLKIGKPILLQQLKRPQNQLFWLDTRLALR